MTHVGAFVITWLQRDEKELLVVDLDIIFNECIGGDCWTAYMLLIIWYFMYNILLVLFFYLLCISV